MSNNRYEVNIHQYTGELDVILGHRDHILKQYQRDNVKLKGGWYYRNIGHNTDFLLKIIEQYKIKKINFIGSSKSCSGCIIFTKELLKRQLDISLHLFMFSPYTTVDRNIYIKRGIEESVPGTLKAFWESDRYTIHAIKRMEARSLIDKPQVHMYLFYPEKSTHGEIELAQRIKGTNVTHIPLPVYMHNTLFPFWREVQSNRRIELYENEFREMHIDDFRFYSRMQNYPKYRFDLYHCIEDTPRFMKNLSQFITNEKDIQVGPHAKLSNTAIIEAPVRLWGNAIVNRDTSIGAFSFINSATTIFPKTHIGRYCSIGKSCEIGAGDHPLDWLSTSVFQYGMETHFSNHKEDCRQFPFEEKKLNENTTIGNDVWIGSLSLIKKGVSIGDGAIIAGGAVVIDHVPPYAVVGGVPAKILRYRFDKETIDTLCALQWWTLTPKEMKNVQFNDIKKAIIQIQKIKNKNPGEQMAKIENENYMLEINSNNGELDVILGHKEFILNKYKRDNLKLKGGWYYRNISENTEILLEVIERYSIDKINFIGASKSCSGCIILTKELTKRIPSLRLNLFMFSAYTTIDKEVYIRRKIIDKAPGTLVSLWESKWYTPHLIKRMEARRLGNRENVHMYFFFPGRSKYGEKQLARRLSAENITFLEIPVYMHNTLYPFWKKVEEDGTIEVYEGTIKKMHKDDFKFYSSMQSYEKYNFHLYSCLENTEGFVKQLHAFIQRYTEEKEK